MKRQTDAGHLRQLARGLYDYPCGPGVRAVVGLSRSQHGHGEAYWQVGRLIVEHEQGSRRRAAYGEAVLDDLSQRLTADFGRGSPQRT